jgi:hypothetical protein
MILLASFTLSINNKSWSCTGEHICQNTAPKEREKKQQKTRKQTDTIIILLISFTLSINKNKSWSALENISVCQQHTQAHTKRKRKRQ